MRIAILSMYSGHLQRGVENWILEFAEKMSGRGHDVTVIQGEERHSQVSYKIAVVATELNWKKADSRGRIWRYLFIDYWSRQVLRFSLRLVSNLWRENYDIILPVDCGWMALITRIIAWLKRSKMVVVGHAGPGQDERSNLLSFPDMFVALSKKAQKWARRNNPFIRVDCLPNGVNLINFQPKGEKKRINLTPPIFLSVGALEKGKRMNLVIEAVAKTKASLLILGKGDEKVKLMKIGNKLLSGRFKLIEVPYKEIAGYYRSADIFTSASAALYSFELVLVEAMACNKPVVANNDLVRKEIVGDGGLLVDPTNTEEYAQTLEKALEIRWGDKPRKQAEKFDWNKIAKKYEELFISLTK